MYDLNQLLTAAAPGVTPCSVWIENSDGTRQKLLTATDFSVGRRSMLQWLKFWQNQSPGRHVINLDKHQSLLLKDGHSSGLVYIDPFPDRTKHPGDMRIDRRQPGYERKPIYR